MQSENLQAGWRLSKIIARQTGKCCVRNRNWFESRLLTEASAKADRLRWNYELAQSADVNPDGYMTRRIDFMKQAYNNIDDAVKEIKAEVAPSAGLIIAAAAGGCAAAAAAVIALTIKKRRRSNVR